MGQVHSTFAEFIAAIEPDYLRRLQHLLKNKGVADDNLDIFLESSLYDLIYVESDMTIASVLYGKLKPNYYVVNNDFHQKFSKTKLANIRYKHLPKNLTGFIRLPTPVKDEDGTEYSNVYFFCGDDSNFFQIEDYRRGHTMD